MASPHASFSSLPPPRPDVTRLLQAWSQGDDGAANQVLQVVYHELRRIAARQLRRERSDHTLQATAVVHEAYLRLRDMHGLEWPDRARFFAFAAGLIRRILVDHARRHNRVKRGGRAAVVTLFEATELAQTRTPDLVALDDALSRLANLDARKAAVVELRFFGGLTIQETAAHFDTSPATIEREWRRARAWLATHLAQSA